jgi:hypothetical protein
MLDRWEGEDCSNEPDWEVSDVGLLRFGEKPALLESR